MKVFIGGYPRWIGPYQIAETLLFWKKRPEIGDDGPDSVHDFGTWLAEKRDGSPSLLARACQWIYGKRKRTVYVKVDRSDTWSADHTLALVILPVLKSLDEDKHGAPSVDDEDVPEHLRSTAAPMLSEEEINCGHPDDNHFKRWDYVLGEMIWAFEQHSNPDWEDQYFSGEIDVSFEKVEGASYSEMKRGAKHTHRVDVEGIRAHRDRMANGRRLFAKYYECLWS